MRCGHKRDAQLAALCDFSTWVCDTSNMHPDDAELWEFRRVVTLTALNELMMDKQQMNDPHSNIVRDRLDDCEDCKRTGLDSCMVNGKHIGKCRWRTGTQKIEFVKERFGEKALKYLKMYPRQKGAKQNVK